ncbi:MAG: glycosyltransferase family 9 protein [Bacteroidia bacterium]|jgi:ADP-heptose:LPS heptosyltransferase|nr:glycosyltransferase family 9 protein [Bacteroidia bacterium]MBP7437800.1 glycosyltransferase family 9 protein [Bacteroidia bacterium]MBP7728075.1 glycosyltransferase family 9 protein [Bacteroidia bacterium]MBP7771256.1 glycosyltransferase family 9 protein [Bacteroidia bacterium]HRU59886.1 glycosyltransferase family 9 protein [Bacteroidia bacterium]
MIRTRTKVVLDAVAGRTLVFFLNLAARVLGRILSIDHALTRPPKTIVVCKYLGMGSIIQATPLLQTLRKNFPDARLVFVTSQANRGLMKQVAAVHEVLTVNDSGLLPLASSSWKLLRRLWKLRPDLYIDLETYSYYSTAIATMSCARNRIGFYRVERNIRMGVYTHMMFFNARAPIAQSYLQMARLVGCREIVAQLYPFRVDEADLASMRRKLERQVGESFEPFVVINPNASDLRIERRWPSERFIALIRSLSQRFPSHRFFLIGSVSEAAYVGEIYRRLELPNEDQVINTAGRLSLGELFALISRSELVVTNDTGPMHIAFSLGRPTVSLFGPASPSQYGDNPHAFGIYKNLYCSPCVHDFLVPPCGGDNQCMKQITLEEVEGLCTRLLRGDRSTAPAENLRFNRAGADGALGVVNRL